MTAVAEMQSTSLADAWLAPSSAVQEIDGQSQMVVLRDGNQMTVSVATGQVQGEWVVVESSELQEGDEVIADLATYTADDNSGFPGGGGGPGGQ
jgi:multidrug efflux pump subunit AcrA (membrane-fusion protein)